MKINTYINVPIADYYHQVDGSLERIVKLVMSHLPVAALQCRSIQLYTLLSGSSPVRVTPTCHYGNNEEPQALLLPQDVIDKIELQFLIMHDLVCQPEKRTVWNKARLVIDNNAEHTYQLALRYDADVEWLESIHYMENTLWHCHVNTDIQANIYNWEGLPADYSRFWAN